MIWTIIELEEDIMVINNLTKFHKILIKIFELERGRCRDRCAKVRYYVRAYGQTGVALNARAIIMAGA